MPQLDVILVGNDPASHLYVKKKKEVCDKLHITCNINYLPSNTESSQVIP